MALIPCKCPVCGGEILVADDKEFTFCTNCGTKLQAPRPAANVGTAFGAAGASFPQQTQAPSQPYPGAYTGYAPQGTAPGTPSFATQATTPFIAQWKTGVGATIGGILLSAAISGLLNYLLQYASTYSELKAVTWIYFILSLVLTILCFVIPPKRFKQEFQGSNGGVSFMNGFLGGIIFGCIWNSNLTNKKTKQVSHIVLGIIELLITLYLGYYAVMFALYL